MSLYHQYMSISPYACTFVSNTTYVPSRPPSQYHWSNAGYATFDDFLMSLRQSRRKTIRQERKRVAKEGIT